MIFKMRLLNQKEYEMKNPFIRGKNLTQLTLLGQTFEYKLNKGTIKRLRYLADNGDFMIKGERFSLYEFDEATRVRLENLFPEYFLC